MQMHLESSPFQSMKNDADTGSHSRPGGVTSTLGANLRGVIHASDTICMYFTFADFVSIYIQYHIWEWLLVALTVKNAHCSSDLQATTVQLHNYMTSQWEGHCNPRRYGQCLLLLWCTKSWNMLLSFTGRGLTSKKGQSRNSFSGIINFIDYGKLELHRFELVLLKLIPYTNPNNMGVHSKRTLSFHLTCVIFYVNSEQLLGLLKWWKLWI